MFEPSQIMEFIFSLPLVGDFWWLWLFIVLVIIAPQLWRAYVQDHYKRSIKWTLLELVVPRELQKTPKAMEQVFMTIHGVRNSATDIQEEWWDGEVPMWFSCEVISFGGDVHIYMRVPEIRRNHIEAALYAHYNDIEVREVQDYIDRLPPTIGALTQNGYKLFGNELVLANKDVYPITTYVDFEAMEEEKELDPVSVLLETLSRLKPQENLWLQILVRPKVDDYIIQWHKEGEKEIDRIKEMTGKRKVFSPQFGEFIMIDRSPGDVEMMKAIDRNISKPAFDVVLRYLYIASKDVFSAAFGRRSILSVMNQYASETFNKFKHNTAAWTLAKIWYWPHIFPKSRARARQSRIYFDYRERRMYPETFTGSVLNIKLFNWGFKSKKISSKMSLNTEELATIFHLPTAVVLTGHMIKRVEAKRGGPPVGLAIYGRGEEELSGVK